VMLWGLVGSLATVTAMLALSDDGLAVGVKVTVIVQVELGEAVVVQVRPVTAKSVALGPVMLPLNDSGNPDRLVTVTVLVLVGVLDVSVPYSSVVGRTFAGIVVPVLSATV
jgi:hypothetical protein